MKEKIVRSKLKEVPAEEIRKWKMYSVAYYVTFIVFILFFLR